MIKSVLTLAYHASYHFLRPTMETTTLSSKGQLVIPKTVRQSAQLAPGDILTVRFVDGEIRLKPVAAVMPTILADVAGCLAKSGRKPLSHAQTQTVIRARLKAKFKVADAAA
jgi:AbrB family looped-hinge helix DNA binding protein